MINYDNLSGMTLGKYTLKALVGTGGMSTVYQGYQHNLKRFVAVKVLRRDLARQEEYLTRFNAEAEIAARLNHPHIVPIYDVGIIEEISFIAMQWLTGGTLWERIRARQSKVAPQYTLPEISMLLGQIAGAMDYAHRQGVIHRDIKPSNIMFDEQGTAFLVDFGIALLKHKKADEELAAGTYAYMAPEVWQGETPTSLVDQYALGLIIYTLVTGQSPYNVPDNEMRRLRYFHIHELPIRAHMLRSDVPESVSVVIERAIAKQPTDRYDSVRNFADAFEMAIRDLRKANFATLSVPPRVLRKSPTEELNATTFTLTPVDNATHTHIVRPPSVEQLTDERPLRNDAIFQPVRQPAPRRQQPQQRIFITCRHEDAGTIAARISSQLKRHFGESTVLDDIGDLPLGVNVKRHLGTLFRQGMVMLVVIGKRWIEVSDPYGMREIDKAGDIHRIGLEAAIDADIPLIPLFVEGAAMPTEAELPDRIRELVHYRGMDMRAEPVFADDMTNLVRQISQILSKRQ